MKKIIILFLALGGLAVRADIAVDPAQFDNLPGKVHRGDLGRSGVFNASGVSSVKGVKWKFQTGGAVKSSPVVVDGVAYFGSHDGAVYAVNAASGARIWSNQTGGKVSGSAAVVSNTVFIASENGRLYAFNATTGATNWSVLIESGRVPAGSPAVAYGVVFIGAGSQFGYRALSMSAGAIYGYSMTNGAQVWKSANSGPQGYAAIALDATNLYAGIGGSSYGAFRITNGANLWAQEQGKQNRQFNSMSVVNGTVFFPGAIRGSVSRYTPGGTKSWLSTTLAQNDDEGYFEMNSGGLFGYEILTDVAVANGLVYAGCNDGRLCTFAQTTGARGWSFQTGGKVQSSPSVAANKVYFGSWDGKVYAVNATNGSEVWSYNLGARIISSPWPADGALYVGCDDGALYCLEEGQITVFTNTLTVASAYGTPSPAGVNLFTSTQQVACTVGGSPIVNGATSIVCSGWTLIGNSPVSGSGTNFTLTLTNNAALTWLWITNVAPPVVTNTLTVASAYGTPHPSGVNLYTSTQQVACTVGGSPIVNGATSIVCSGWTLIGNSPVSGSGTNFTLTLTNSAALTWLWITNVAPPVVSNSLTVASAYGSPTPSGLNWYTNGSIVACSVAGSPIVNGRTSIVCTGWASIGNSPVSGSGTNFTLTLTNNAALTWLWTTNVASTNSGSMSFQNGVYPTSAYAGTDDATMSGGSPTVSYGTDVSLSLRGTGAFWDYVVRWAVTGLPAGVTITNARMSFTEYNTPYTGTASIYACKRDWIESVVTYNTYDGTNAWETGGAQGTGDKDDTLLGSFDLSATGEKVAVLNSSGIAYIQSWVGNPANNKGFVVLSSSGSRVYLRSSEYSTAAAERPKLTVDYGADGGTQTCSLTVTVNNTNWGSVTPTGGVYSAGSNVQISATASNYYHFAQWSGDLSDTSNPANVTMTTNLTIQAVFAANLLTNNVPAWWLAQNNLATNDAGALSDTDLDGLAAWQEYIAGTVPTNAGSVFNITKLSVPGPPVVRWSTVSGRVYTVYWTSNLLNGFATVLGTNLPWTGNVFTDAVHGADGKGFYRIDVKLE